MPIIRINQLPEGSGSLTSDDILLMMDDPSGSGVTKKITVNELSDLIGSVISIRKSYTLFKTTTDNTANVVLTKDGNSATSSNILIIPSTSAWYFNIQLIAYNSSNHTAASWNFRGTLKRDNSNNTTIIGSIITESAIESGLPTASVVADDTNEALELRVTGLISSTITWIANVDIIESF